MFRFSRQESRSQARTPLLGEVTGPNLGHLSFGAGVLVCLGLVALLGGCGAAYGVIFGASGSSSGSASSNDGGGGNPATPLLLLGQTPADGELAAEPERGVDFSGGTARYLALTLDFDQPVDPASFVSSHVTILEEGSPLNAFDDLVAGVQVNGASLDVWFVRPMIWRSTYQVSLGTGVTSADGGALDLAATWSFDVRDGQVGPRETVNFPASVRALAVTEDLTSLALLEGDNQGNNIVAVSSAAPGEDFDLGVVLRNSALVTGEAQLTISPLDDSLRSVAWLEGEPSCSMMGPDPLSELWVSQFINGAWEDDISGDGRRVDGSLAATGEHLSWNPEIRYMADGETVAVFWGWTDYDNLDLEFDTWQVWAARRPLGGDWLPAEMVSSGTTARVGWPTVALSPDSTRLYALWGLAECVDCTVDDIFDGADTMRHSSWEMSVYEAGAWSAVTSLLPPPPSPGLSRPTDMHVLAGDLAVVFGRSATMGILAYTIDLALGELVGPVPIDNGGETFMNEDRVFATGNNICGRFGSIRRNLRVRSPVATLLPSGTELVVTWAGHDLNEFSIDDDLRIARYDVIGGTWTSALVNVPLDPLNFSSFFQAAGVQLDDAGGMTLGWEYEAIRDLDADGEVDPDEPLVSYVLAARSIDGGINFDPVQVEGVVAPDGILSDPSPCARGLVLGQTPASGRLIFGWGELSACTGGNPVGIVVRRFE